MTKLNPNERQDFSQFFSDLGFTPNDKAQIIKTPLEKRMEILRYQQKEKGLCACVLLSNHGRGNQIKLCRNKPRVLKNGLKAPIGYCRTHQRFEKTHSLKYLGFSIVRNRGRPRKSITFKGWRRHRKFKSLNSPSRPKKETLISLIHAFDDSVMASALLELEELRM